MRSGRAIAYLTTTAAIGLAVRSVVRQPLPPAVVAGASAGLVGVLLAGVFEPRLGMFADTILRGEPGEPGEGGRVALTFDDGPSARTTPRVLDALDAANAKGTFFVIGRKLEGEGLAVARDALARGHEIACHSFAHDRLFALRGRARVRDDVRRAVDALDQKLGVKTRWFRPPVLHTNPIIADVADELGLRIVAFSVRGYDGTARAEAARVAARVASGLGDGAIALLHDASEREDFEPVAAEALPVIVEKMKARGLRGVTLTEVIGADAEG